VPYKGASPAVLAVVSGEADVATPSAPGALPQIAAGKLRALAVSSDKRLARLPDVPTVAELGYPKAAMSGWVGLHAPAGLPRPLLTLMESAVAKAIANPAVKARLEQQGANVGFAPAAQYREFTLREMERWKGVVAVAGIKPE
jgi:tripartite-type tricarboxylate transporter receptor subunit TctC